MLSGYTRKFKPLEIISEEEVESIHRGALFVLESTGMRVDHDRALKLFSDAGCDIDWENNRVRMPSGLVEECVRMIPSSYIIKARDREKDLMIGGDTLYFMQGMGMKHLDLDTWETRPATMREHKESMIVADALDDIHLADAVFAYTEIKGVPAVMTQLENLASGIRNSSKAQQFGYSQDSEVFAIKMAKELGMILNPEMDTANPLTIYGGSIEAVFRYIEAGFPVEPCTGMAMGAEGATTCAAAAVQGCASIMGWAVLTQLIKEGAPMSIQSGLKPMDMKTGCPDFASTTQSLTTVMINQMLRFYNIPSCTSAGFTSLSKKIDYQCGYEKSMGALIAALSGGNLQIFQGGSCSELLYHPALSILDNDVAGWVGRFLQGAEVSDESLAISLINQVGPVPGHYLNTKHTREHWKKEHYVPAVADRAPYPEWITTGKKDTLTLAQERMDHIVKTHTPLPLTPEQEKIVDNTLTEARDYYRKKGLISDEEWTEYVEALEANG